MKVIATAKGYSGQVREVGDEFEVPDNARGSWFKPVKDDQPEAAKTAPQGKHGKGHKPDADADPI